MNIAIDGPSGAGKSTIAKIIAAELNITYLDTGAMYRALALKAYNNGLSMTDEHAIDELMLHTSIDFVPGEKGSVILLDGKDVSKEIREHHFSKLSSDISALKNVRAYMVELQRKIASRRDSVLDGRDIGTVVLPNADFKFYLTASVEVRARRRYIELLARGEKCDEAKIREDIVLRDYNDMHRQYSPLRKADDAIEIDSTDLDIDGVKARILSVIKAKS